VSIISELDELRREVERLKTKETQKWVHLTTPLTSTDWDGDAHSTTDKTVIDLSAVFGVPAGVKAVLIRWVIRDSGAAATDCTLYLSPVDTTLVGPGGGDCHPVNDRQSRGSSVVPCDSAGDIYYQISASGAGTFDAVLQIWGYLL